MHSADTDATAAAMQEDSYRSVGEAGRLLVALELSDLTHALALAGVNDRYPGIAEDEAKRLLARMLYGQGPAAE